VIPRILQHRGGDFDLYVPLSFAPADLAPQMRNRKYVDVLARMKPGVTVAKAEADLASIAGRLSAQYPSAYPREFGFSLDATLLAGNVAGDLRTPLLVLIAAVGALMLIACANVSSLLLARAVLRRREMTIRAALGAGRARAVRQLLSESVVLAGAAAALGIGIAVAVLKLYNAYGPGEVLRVSGLALNGWVAAFAVAISAAASVLFGVAPALDAARIDLNEALKESSRGTSGRRRRLRQVLVGLEVAASVVLLTGAGLLTRSFVRLQQANPGFRAENVLTFQLVLPAAQYPQPEKRNVMFAAVLARLRALPGVVAAGAIDPLPFTGGDQGASIGIVGRQENPGAPQPVAGLRRTTPGYFEAMGIPLVRGRLFTAADTKGGPLVALIDQGVVQRYFPNHEDPIGQRLTGGEEGPATIVGVVGPVKQLDLAAAPQMAVYNPADQVTGLTLSVVMKTAGDPLALLAAARREVAAVDPNVPVARSATMEQRLADSLARQRIAVELMNVFAVLAGLLAAIGIYSVLSYLVDQRRREVAIRMALGARSGQVVKLVTTQGAWPVGLGLVVGLAGALAATRLLKTLLFDTSAADPLVFAGAAMLLVAVALIAMAIPARRATTVDPVVALRDE
jgi:putative ABC transport system permease protein